jgi:hypothetical protein
MNQPIANFCEKCGAKLEAGSRFCETCGHPVTAPQRAAAGQQAAGKSTGKKTVLIVGGVVLIAGAIFTCIVVLLVFALKPGNLFNNKLEQEQAIPLETQDFLVLTVTSERPAEQKITKPAVIEKTLKPTTTKEPTSRPAVKITPSATTEPIGEVKADRSKFYCLSSDGPTTLTISASAGKDIRDLTLRWRLNTKKGGTTTAWEGIYMENTAPGKFSFKFNADTWGGTNNFYYPPMLGESWFEYQVFIPDGSYQTEIIKNVTFFPCAQ